MNFRNDLFPSGIITTFIAQFMRDPSPSNAKSIELLMPQTFFIHHRCVCLLGWGGRLSLSRSLTCNSNSSRTSTGVSKNFTNYNLLQNFLLFICKKFPFEIYFPHEGANRKKKKTTRRKKNQFSWFIAWILFSLSRRALMPLSFVFRRSVSEKGAN